MSLLRAGYGEAAITPPLGTDLTGFGFYLDRKAERILDDLKVRALYLASRETRLLIISCDLLGLTVAQADGLRSQVDAASGGDRGLVLQGFCGDIDPVVYLNRRQGATAADLVLYGKVLADRAKKVADGMTIETEPRLRAREERIRLPLLVPSKGELKKEEAKHKNDEEIGNVRTLLISPMDSTVVCLN